VTTKDRRTAFEYAATKGALAGGIPVLGICGGQQLLNVVLGGTLIQHIPDEVADCVAHRQPNPRNEPGHAVRVIAGTLLHRITSAATLAVNSAHHQAVKEGGPGIIINAVAEDGVVEGIEDPRHRFCLGVQWHPEFEINEADRRIFRVFVEVAGG
jgi:putative glutamine amidotransferase